MMRTGGTYVSPASTANDPSLKNTANLFVKVRPVLQGGPACFRGEP